MKARTRLNLLSVSWSHRSAIICRTLFLFAAMVMESEENLCPKGARSVCEVRLDSISILISPWGLCLSNCVGVKFEEEEEGVADTEGAIGMKGCCAEAIGK